MNNQTREQLQAELGRAELELQQAKRRLLDAQSELNRWTEYLSALNAVVRFKPPLMEANNVVAAGDIFEQVISELVGGAPIKSDAPVRDNSKALFEREKRPLQLEYINKHLQAKGMRLGENSVWMALRRMQRQGIVDRVKRGVYILKLKGGKS